MKMKMGMRNVFDYYDYYYRDPFANGREAKNGGQKRSEVKE